MTKKADVYQLVIDKQNVESLQKMVEDVSKNVIFWIAMYYHPGAIFPSWTPPIIHLPMIEINEMRESGSDIGYGHVVVIRSMRIEATTIIKELLTIGDLKKYDFLINHLNVKSLHKLVSIVARDPNSWIDVKFVQGNDGPRDSDDHTLVFTSVLWNASINQAIRARSIRVKAHRWLRTNEVQNDTDKTEPLATKIMPRNHNTISVNTTWERIKT